MDKPTSGRVDENQMGIGLAQQSGIDEACVIRGQRTIQAHHICPLESLFHRDFSHAFRKFLLTLVRHGPDVHAKSRKDACHSLSDMTKTDDGHLLSKQFHTLMERIAEIGRLLPASGTVGLRIFSDGVGHFEQERSHQLGHRLA